MLYPCVEQEEENKESVGDGSSGSSPLQGHSFVSSSPADREQDRLYLKAEPPPSITEPGKMDGGARWLQPIIQMT